MDKPIIDILWVLLCAGLVLMMQAGFLCLEAGLTRTKNAINVAVKNLTDFGVAVVLFWAFGFALMFGATKGGWIGSSHFFSGLRGTRDEEEKKHSSHRYLDRALDESLHGIAPCLSQRCSL